MVMTIAFRNVMDPVVCTLPPLDSAETYAITRTKMSRKRHGCVKASLTFAGGKRTFRRID